MSEEITDRRIWLRGLIHMQKEIRDKAQVLIDMLEYEYKTHEESLPIVWCVCLRNVDPKNDVYFASMSKFTAEQARLSSNIVQENSYLAELSVKNAKKRKLKVDGKYL